MKRKKRNQYPNMAKWIKISEMAEKCTALFFHCFLFERGVHCFTYQKKTKKQTNKQNLLLSEFVYNWYQFYIYIYIYREREREREREIFIWFNFWEIDLFGKSIFLSLAMNMTIFINKELFCFNMSIFFFFLF